MSRKSRLRKAARRALPPAELKAPSGRSDPAEQAKVLSALEVSARDGYSNAAAFLGADSPLLASGTYLPSGLTSNPRLLTNAYREFWLATRIIDTPAEDMTRAWYSLTGDFTQEELADLRRPWRQSTA